MGQPGGLAHELRRLVQVVVLLGLQQRAAALVGQVLRRRQLPEQHPGRHRVQPAAAASHQTHDQRDPVQSYARSFRSLLPSNHTYILDYYYYSIIEYLYYKVHIL